jgi:predicted DNA-binding transcriptional regulator AlpA
MTINPITFTAGEAAEFLGLATSTLAKLRSTGNGPAYCKLGRRVVYRMEDLEAWLESRVARDTSDADARLPKSLTGKRVEKTDGRSKTMPKPCQSGLSRGARGRPADTDPPHNKAVISKRSSRRASETRKS